MAEVNTSTCRFYENKYPEVDDLVVVNVKEIADMGAYVKLLEYDDIEGMILLSELSRRRIRSIQKLIKVGRNEVVVVLRVDKDKGYIDLSKRRVSPEEAIKCEERYNKSKGVHSILRHVAEKHKIPLEELYEKIGWPLSRKYGHAYEAFKAAISSPDTVFQGIEFPSEEVKEDLMVQIARKLTPNPTKVRADVEVTCFNYDGIDAIRNALNKGVALHTEDVPLTIKLLAAPLFVFTSISLNKQAALDKVQEAIDVVKETIEAAGGSVNVKMEPKAISDSEDAEMQALMAREEQAMMLRDGDDDESEEED